jgi:hypothetical protein
MEASDQPIDDGHWEIQGDWRSLYEITEKQTPFFNGFKSIMNRVRAKSHMPSIYHSWSQDRCASLPLRMVLSGQASGDRPLPLRPLPRGCRPLERIEADSGRTRIASVCGMLMLDN